MTIGDVLERRAERGVERGADAVWAAAIREAAEAQVAEAPSRSGFRLAVAAITVVVLGALGFGWSSRGEQIEVGPADEPSIPTGDPWFPGHAPVVVRGFDMVEAWSGPAVSDNSTWHAFVDPGGPSEAVVLVGTSPSGDLELRQTGIDRQTLSEFLQLDASDHWTLSSSSGLEGPVEFRIPETPREPVTRYAFVDRVGGSGVEVLLEVSRGPIWPSLHSVLSDEGMVGLGQSFLDDADVLGFDGLASTRLWGSSVLWSDGEWSYLAVLVGPALDESEPIPDMSSEALIDLIELAPRDEWADAVLAAQPDYGDPWTVVVGRLAAAAMIVAPVAFALVWYVRRRRARAV